LNAAQAVFAILSLGFAVGLQHAFEADHLAAVASLSARSRHFKDVVLHGLTWGLGHALTLLILAGGVFLAGSVIPETWASRLEFFVGVMLVGLGAQALLKLWRERAHVHVHAHDGAKEHLHLHSHRDSDAHQHEHGFRWRTLVVGLMHGLAGSAALLLLAATRVKEPGWGLAYIAVFGVGSMLGMGVLSAAIAVPLSVSAKKLTALHSGLHGVIGAGTVFIGAQTIAANW